MLAPMEGVSHPELRALVAARGGVGIVCTEFVRVTKSPIPSDRLRREVVKAPGLPLSVQVMGNEAERMAEAAAVVAEQGPDAAAARTGDQPPPPLADLPAHEAEQLARVAALEPFTLGHRLALAQDEVHDPAPPDVNLIRVAAVREDLLVLAAGVLERVGEDGHRAEVPRLVHLTREQNRGLRAPIRGEGNGAKRVAEDVVND